MKESKLRLIEQFSQETEVLRKERFCKLVSQALSGKSPETTEEEHLFSSHSDASAPHVWG